MISSAKEKNSMCTLVLGCRRHFRSALHFEVYTENHLVHLALNRVIYYQTWIRVTTPPTNTTGGCMGLPIELRGQSTSVTSRKVGVASSARSK